MHWGERPPHSHPAVAFRVVVWAQGSAIYSSIAAARRVGVEDNNAHAPCHTRRLADTAFVRRTTSLAWELESVAKKHWCRVVLLGSVCPTALLVRAHFGAKQQMPAWQVAHGRQGQPHCENLGLYGHAMHVHSAKCSETTQPATHAPSPPSAIALSSGIRHLRPVHRPPVLSPAL
jgi:hypothetical protein